MPKKPTLPPQTFTPKRKATAKPADPIALARAGLAAKVKARRGLNRLPH